MPDKSWADPRNRPPRDTSALKKPTAGPPDPYAQTDAVGDALPGGLELAGPVIREQDGSILPVPIKESPNGPYEAQLHNLMNEFWKNKMLTDFVPGANEKRDDLVYQMLARELARRGIQP